MISIVVADDRALLREALARLVAAMPGCRVTCECGTGADLRSRLADKRADIVLLHASSGTGTAAVIASIRAASDLPVLVLGSHPPAVLSAIARRAGATGHITTDCSPDELVAAIRDTVAAEATGRTMPRAARDGAADLSDREFEVLCLMGAGRNGRAVADHLGISPKTVSTYRTRIMDKLELESTADIVRYALEHGLLD